MRSNLIALNGSMGSGKTAAFEYLKAAVKDTEVVLVKFAQPLYDMQEFVYGRISSVYQRPSTFIKDRKLLQWLGTEWGRDSIRESLWCDIWVAEVKKAHEAGKIVVCDDLRYDNEAAVVKALGGMIVKISSNRTQERIDTNAGIKNHNSEKGIDTNFVDMIIENNDTLESYKGSLSVLCQQLGF